jgi:hypothetical protein
MRDHNDIEADLEPLERELDARLATERPVPHAGFRGALARHLQARDPGYGARPERLRLIVGAYLGAGAALIALGAAGAVGVL